MVPSFPTIRIRLVIMLFFHPHFQALASAAQSLDFGYMKSVYEASDQPFVEEYDYIVIGGGTAGCPLAATLSERYSVLVLERGSAPIAHPNVLTSNAIFNLMQEDNGTTPTQRFTSEDGVANVRGRVLGGSSMINGGVYSRADQEFFSKSGVNWNMDSVEKAYQWVEETLVSELKLTDPAGPALIQALMEVGIVPDNGFNLDHVLGTKVSGSIFDEMGRRHGAVELLNRGNLKNLRVVVHATVEKIIFSTEPLKTSAIGVTYTDSKGKYHQALVHKKGEVILSAGAIGSPQLLLLSGIGPHSYLSSLHIPVVYPQPNVGKFMFDNPRNGINLIIPSPSIQSNSSAPYAGITDDYYIFGTFVTLPFSPIPSPFGFFPSSYSQVNLSIQGISTKIPGPLSNGSLWLSSSIDVKAGPHVQFNYYTDSIDLSRCVSAMRKIGQMLNTTTMERLMVEDSRGTRSYLFYGPPLPKNQLHDSSLEAFCRSKLATVYHYHGGCLVDKVVDGEFRVMGINGLRVVDGSTFVTSPGTNPQATVMMLGRYVGLKMLRERSGTK